LLASIGWASVSNAAPEGTTPAWSLHLRSTGYRFEDARPLEPTVDRFGFYHHFDASVLRVGGGALDVRASGRFADDTFLKNDVTNRSRLHTAYLLAHLGERSTARLGRQFLQAGPFGFTLDGAAITLAPSRAIELLAWGGARAPADFDYDTRNLSDEHRAGARLAWKPSFSTRVAGSFASIEENGRPETRLVGFDGSTRFFRQLTVSGRASYDVETEAWDREEVRIRWQLERRWPVVTLQGIDRRQAPYASRFFQLFDEDTERLRLGRVVVHFEPVPGFGAEVSALGTDVEDTESGHVSWAVLFPYGRVGYLRRTGERGEADRWTGDLGFGLLPWLRFDGGVTAETYALFDTIEEETDEQDLISGFARLRANVTEGFSLVVEGQDRTTPELTEDWRLLFGAELTVGMGSPAGPSITRGRHER